MAIASASNTVCIGLRLMGYPCRYTNLHCIVYCIFILCILSPGRLIKKVGRDVVDRDFVLFVVLFLIIYGVCFIVRRTSVRECPV